MIVVIGPKPAITFHRTETQTDPSCITPKRAPLPFNNFSFLCSGLSMEDRALCRFKRVSVEAGRCGVERTSCEGGRRHFKLISGGLAVQAIHSNTQVSEDNDED